MRSVHLPSITLAFLIGALGAVSHAGVHQRDILPTTQVSPVRFGLGSTTLPIDVRWPLACPCTMSLTNGAPASGLLSPTRVLAGWIWVDNVLVLTPIQISMARASASATLALAPGPHQIRLQLIGLSTSYVRVGLSGSASVTDLAAPRAEHSANLLPDGSVLVAGGESALGVLDSTEWIAGDASSTAASEPLTQMRAGHAATLVAGGATMLAGGRDGSGVLSGVEVRTAMGSVAGIPLGEGRRDHTATTLLDGRVLILGGTTGDGAASNTGLIIDPRPDPFTDGQYDPAAATVTALGPVLQTARSGHTATLLDDGTVLVIGGRNDGIDLRSMELVDPDAGTSMALSALVATGRSNHTATLRSNGSILVAGGRNGAALLASVEVVGPALTGVTTGGSLAIARAGHSATMIRGGEILIAGGWTAVGVTANTELAPPLLGDALTPSIAAISPGDDAVDVDRGIVIGIQASEPLDPATVSAAHIGLQDGSGTPIAAAIGITDHGTLITVRPDALLPGDTYTVTVTGVADRAGLVLPPFSFSFTTIATPVITTIAPIEGPVGTEVTVSGSGFGAAAADHQLTFGTMLVPVVPESPTALTFTVPAMAPGSYPIALRTRGGLATAPSPFVIRNPAPTLSVISPSHVAAGSAAFILTLTGTNFVNGATVVVATTPLTATFVSATSLQAEVPASSIAVAGVADVHVVNPGPGGGASNTVPLMVDSVGPTLTSVTVFPRGMSLSIGGSQQFTAQAHYSDGTTTDITRTAKWASSAPGVVTVTSSGAARAAAGGSATITVSLGQSAEAPVRVYTGEAIPPDPSDVAPDLNPTESTTTADATRFLFEGENPIQRGVTAGAVEVRLASVIRGVARTRDGQPLSGVRVAIKDRDDVGYTLTRLDGAFDMAINGGGSVVVLFSKIGFIPIDRRVVVPAGDFYPVPDVVLIALDPQVTEVDLTAAVPIQVARGSVVSDDSGSRQATVLVPQGTTAQLRLPDGSTAPLTSMHVRATEYTVGASGPAAMPGTLPDSSAYTHAVELSADEALAAGADAVEFGAPIPVYYENFLGFPIGAGVPTGYYDRTLSTWVPSDNGVVLKVLSIDGSGRAELDLDGDALPDDAAALAELGITDAERATLAVTYTVGQGLWRVPVRHFTPFDHNWPRRFPSDAELVPRVPPPQTNEKSKDTCETAGSIIECQDQILGERLPLAGTPFTINYRSDRAPGYTASDSVAIPLTAATVPASMIRIDLTVRIAGQVFSQSFVPAPGLTTEFTWNRRDIYGRPVHGTRTAHITIQHVYPVYYVPRPTARRPFQFGRFNVTEVAPDMFLVPGRELWAVPSHRSVELGPPPQASPSVGGWSIEPHHVYDPAERTLFYGDGSKRIADPQVAAPPIESLDLPEFAYLNAVVASDGIYYVRFEDGYQVFRKTATGPTAVVGTLADDYSIAVDRNGVLHDAHCTAGVPDRVSISRIVAGGSELIASAVLPGGQSCRNSSLGLVRAPDGTMSVSTGNALLTMLSDETLELLAVYDNFAYGIAVGPDGTLYRNADGDHGGLVIERVTSSGTIVRVAGNGFEGNAGDGGRAVDAELGFIYDFAVAADGSLLLADFGDNAIRLRRVGADGFIRTFAAGAIDDAVLLPNGTPATAIGYIQHVDVGPDGWIYAFGHHGYRFAPDFDLSRTTTIASENGSEIYEFTPAGRHLRTINALTGANRYTFDYDSGGRLTAITDGGGLVTQIHRTSAGTPTAIVAPFGQTSAVTTTSDGWLATLVAPGSRTTTLTTTASGLLTALRDARNEVHTFAYDSKGRLIRDDDPAGGSQTLGRATGTGGWVATRTSEMGRETSYRTERLEANGAQQLTMTAPDGTAAVTISHEDGSRETTAADGTQSVVTVTADPRFGLQVPIPASMSVTTSGGLTLAMQMERYVEFGDPQDYSTLYQWDYSTVNGRTYETIFEGATRTFTTTTPAGRVSTATIDAQGRVTRTQVGSLTPVDFTYDAQGRLTTTTQGARQSTIAYDGSGRPSALTDALIRTVTFGYDAADRVTTQTLPDTRTIGFGYDANSNMTTLTPPSRPAHTFTYTPIDVASSYTPPTVAGTGPTGYLFNADRQPMEVQRPDGQTTTFAYGARNGRLTGVTFSRGTLQYGYDTAGRVSSLADPGGVNLLLTYDGRLPLSETWSGPVAGAVSRTFTNNFELATEKVDDAFAVAFGYDNDRLLTSAGALTISRHPEHGMVTGTTLAGTTETHEHNTFGEPSRQTAQVNGTQVFDVQLTRDALGRITQRIEVVDGITRLFEYGYDLAGRLGTLRRNGTLVVLYTYDGNGNRLSAEGEAGLFEATYDDQDRLLTYGPTSYTYTANGELATKTTAGQATSYVYDTLGNLLQVTKPSGQVITYTVDGRGRRVRKAIDGVAVKGWLYADQLRPIAELDGAGAVVSRFVYGTKPNVPEYVIKSGETYRIISDHLGTPRVVVHATTAAVVQRFDVQPFGEIIQDSAPGWQPFGFAGGLYDSDTGLVRFGARDYDPQSGRWTAKDPITFRGRGSNLYSYVGNDPVDALDPSGLIIAHPGDLLDWASFASDLVSFIGCPSWGSGGSLLLSTIGLLPVVTGLGWIDDAARAADKFRRTPNNLMDQMVLEAAKQGKGIKIIENLGDPQFKGMEKWSYGETSASGMHSEVHYVRNPATGELLDFKFK